jgi:hypothetical protein
LRVPALARYHDVLHVSRIAHTAMKPSTLHIRPATTVAAGVLRPAGAVRMSGSNTPHPKL